MSPREYLEESPAISEGTETCWAHLSFKDMTGTSIDCPGGTSVEAIGEITETAQSRSQDLRVACPLPEFSHVLTLLGSCVAGSLPESWGSPGAFPQLRVLAMRNSSLQGPLPQSWGNSSRAMPSLTILTMDSNKLSGSLPASWSQGFSSLS